MSSHPRLRLSELAARGWHALSDVERDTLRRLLRQHQLSRNVDAELADRRTLGERVADRVAAFGGSWPFIGLFTMVLVGWVLLNSLVLARRHEAFDPYPYILLNLFLSMLAAIQAPVIMMSQNRQAARDRLMAQHDYEVNLKAELEIQHLHEKLDSLREERWQELVAQQERQLRLLDQILGRLESLAERGGAQPG